MRKRWVGKSFWYLRLWLTWCCLIWSAYLISLIKGNVRHIKPAYNFYFILRLQSLCGFKRVMLVKPHMVHCFTELKDLIQSVFYLRHKGPLSYQTPKLKKTKCLQLALLKSSQITNCSCIYLKCELRVYSISKNRTGWKCSSCCFHYLVCFFQGSNLLQGPLFLSSSLSHNWWLPFK